MATETMPNCPACGQDALFLELRTARLCCAVCEYDVHVAAEIAHLTREVRRLSAEIGTIRMIAGQTAPAVAGRYEADEPPALAAPAGLTCKRHRRGCACREAAWEDVARQLDEARAENAELTAQLRRAGAGQDRATRGRAIHAAMTGLDQLWEELGDEWRENWCDTADRYHEILATGFHSDESGEDDGNEG